MTIAYKFMRLIGSPPPEGMLSHDFLNTFESVQRDRFIWANLLSVSIITVSCLLGALLSEANAPLQHAAASILVIVLQLYCLRLAYRVRSIETLCRIWTAGCAVALWMDVYFSGGITAYNAPTLLLIPIAAGLLLRPSDILFATFSSAFATLVIGSMTYMASPPDALVSVVSDTVLLAATTIAAGVTIFALVAHHHKVDKTRHRLMLAKEYVAQHDGLTGLVNRAAIAEHLATLSPKKGNYNLFLTDLDGFKEINDAYGHQVGDELLTRVAARLRENAPSGAIVARLGGDEFLLLARADHDGRTIGWHNGDCPGKAIVSALNVPFQVDGLELKMSGSVGVAHMPADARTGEELLRRADLALYAAKDAGRNQCFTFEPFMEAEQNKLLALQHRLRTALENKDIFLNYQPQFCLQTNRLVGFEALARWKDEMLGIVAPDKFIPIAEDCGMISQLGEQVLHRACREALEWPAMQDGAQAVRLSVNISTLQLGTADIVPQITRVLQDTGFPANRLELEITESVLISDPEKVMITLNELAAMGISIAMDDFGKGYSSLSYLQNFSLTRLKIDRSFINNIDQPNGASIVRAIIQLAEAMDLSVVAEGVETEAQRHTLAELGCHFAQGYLYAPGLSPSDTLKLIIAKSVQTGHAVRIEANLPALDDRATG